MRARLGKRLSFALAVAVSAACVRGTEAVADGSDDAAATQPAAAAQPWAVRTTGEGSLLIIQDSSVAVPVPRGMGTGKLVGFCFIAPKDNGYHIQFSVAPGDQVSSDTATAAANALAKAMGGSIVNGSLAVDNDPNFPGQVHFTIDRGIHGLFQMVLRQKVVDSQIVSAATYPHPGTALPAGALDQAAEALNQAHTVERKPVKDHREVGEMAERATAESADRADAASKMGGPPHHPGAQGQPPTDSGGAASSSSGAAQLDAWATAALAAAKKMQSSGNDAGAYDRYQYILHEYPRSAAAKDAQDAVTAYEANADLMAKIHPKASATQPSAAPAAVDPAARAAGLLSMGENYLTAGENDLARSKFQAVVQQFPDSPSAGAAKQHLSDMDAAGK